MRLERQQSVGPASLQARCQGGSVAGVIDVAYPALTIAKWFVAWAEAEDADLSNLKLQKLLYYAQGHHLGAHGTPLFEDPVQAWAHGPVVPNVYHPFKEFGSGDVHLSDSDPFEWTDVDEDTTDLLIRTWNTYGGYAAWRLRNLTHRERPWANVFDFNERSTVISQDSMRSHFEHRAGRR